MSEEYYKVIVTGAELAALYTTMSVMSRFERMPAVNHCSRKESQSSEWESTKLPASVSFPDNERMKTVPRKSVAPKSSPPLAWDTGLLRGSTEIRTATIPDKAGVTNLANCPREDINEPARTNLKFEAYDEAIQSSQFSGSCFGADGNVKAMVLGPEMDWDAMFGGDDGDDDCAVDLPAREPKRETNATVPATTCTKPRMSSADRVREMALIKKDPSLQGRKHVPEWVRALDDYYLGNQSRTGGAVRARPPSVLAPPRPAPVVKVGSSGTVMSELPVQIATSVPASLELSKLTSGSLDTSIYAVQVDAYTRLRNPSLRLSREVVDGCTALLGPDVRELSLNTDLSITDAEVFFSKVMKGEPITNDEEGRVCTITGRASLSVGEAMFLRRVSILNPMVFNSDVLDAYTLDLAKVPGFLNGLSIEVEPRRGAYYDTERISNLKATLSAYVELLPRNMEQIQRMEIDEMNHFSFESVHQLDNYLRTLEDYSESARGAQTRRWAAAAALFAGGAAVTVAGVITSLDEKPNSKPIVVPRDNGSRSDDESDGRGGEEGPGLQPEPAPQPAPMPPPPAPTPVPEPPVAPEPVSPAIDRAQLKAFEKQVANAIMSAPYRVITKAKAMRLFENMSDTDVWAWKERGADLLAERELEMALFIED